MRFFLGVIFGAIFGTYLYQRMKEQRETRATEETVGRANLSEQPIEPVVAHGDEELDQPLAEPPGAPPDSTPTVH